MGFIQTAPLSGRTFRRLTAALAATAGTSMVFAAATALASPGSLNANFGTGGNLVRQLGLGSTPASQGGGVAVAPDGDIYQVGSASSSIPGDHYSLYIARYLPDGTPDTSFGMGGVAYENIEGGDTALPGGGPLGSAEFVAVTPSGDPVVLTNASTTGGTELAVVEFNQSGQLNTSFGTGGVYQVNVSGKASTPGGIAVTSDGAIVVTGAYTNSSSHDEFFAEQLTSSGTPDGNFGTGGLLDPTFGSVSDSMGEGVIAQSDGNLAFVALVAGSSSPSLAVLRTDASGRLDGGFGAGGVAYLPSSTSLPLGPGFTQTADGGYAVADSQMNGSPSYPEASVTRLTASGRLDSSFGSAGTALLPTASLTISVADGVFAEPDGKLIVTGIGAGGVAGAPFVALLNANGTPDTGFGGAGVSVNDVAGTASAFPAAAAQTADGNIVLSGLLTGPSPSEAFLQEVNVDTAPVLVTIADANTVQAGTPVQLAAAGVAADGETLGPVSWDLGSGNFGDATGNTASKTFTTPGIYTVRAKVTDGYGLSTTSPQTITVTAAPAKVAPTTVTVTTPAPPTPAGVTPAQAVAPALKLVKLTASHGKIKATLLCAFAACNVNANLSTHVHKGKGSSLSANGQGKTITVASSMLTLGVNQTRTVTIKLNKAGRKLLAEFKKIPATGSFRLTNTTSAQAITRKLTIH